MVNHAQLNHRQRKFAELIVGGSTAKAAYFEAFPRCRAESTALTEGSKLLRNPNVSAFIGSLRWEVSEKSKSDLVLTMKERREFLARVVRSAPGEINEDDPVCQSFKFTDTSREIKLPDKLRAIELDAKLAGELNDPPVAPGITIVIDAGSLAAMQVGYKEFQEAHGRN